MNEPDALNKINKLTRKSTRVLFRASTVFPFDLFPNELIIDENQVNVINRTFFATAYAESVLLTEVQQVTVNTSLIFASLEIAYLKPGANPLKLDYLWKNDAQYARRLIQGLNAILKENIDLSDLDVPTILDRATKIGRELD